MLIGAFPLVIEKESDLLPVEAYVPVIETYTLEQLCALHSVYALATVLVQSMPLVTDTPLTINVPEPPYALALIPTIPTAREATAITATRDFLNIFFINKHPFVYACPSENKTIYNIVILKAQKAEAF